MNETKSPRRGKKLHPNVVSPLSQYRSQYRSGCVIIEALREERRVQGLGREELAAISGYSAHTLMKWELGMASPVFAGLKVIAEILGYEIVLKKKES